MSGRPKMGAAATWICMFRCIISALNSRLSFEQTTYQIVRKPRLHSVSAVCPSGSIRPTSWEEVQRDLSGLVTDAGPRIARPRSVRVSPGCTAASASASACSVHLSTRPPSVLLYRLSLSPLIAPRRRPDTRCARRGTNGRRGYRIYTRTL
jgi:hypothetical protein